MLHASHSQQHSRNITIQDIPSINAENTKIQGSIHSGIKYEECATSGAKRLTIAKTTGNTQQNRCGSTVAIIPSFTALFFIFYPKFLNVQPINRACTAKPWRSGVPNRIPSTILVCGATVTILQHVCLQNLLVVEPGKHIVCQRCQFQARQHDKYKTHLGDIFYIYGVPSRNRTCIRGLGNPRSIQLNYRDSRTILPK